MITLQINICFSAMVRCAPLLTLYVRYIHCIAIAALYMSSSYTLLLLSLILLSQVKMRADIAFVYLHVYS